MTTQELAYTAIERLVQNFISLPATQRKWMNEMQTRLGYILPLFRALGWDTSNINNLDQVRNLERQVAQVDEKIDQRVYALYRLSPDEIKIVEGKE